MAQSADRPTAAFVLSLIGGIFILMVGILLGIIGFTLTIFVAGVGGILGIFGLVWGIIVILGSVMMYRNPEQHTLWGIIVLVFSIVSWFGALGGLFIGFLLGLIGGILGIAWKPSYQKG